jgi:two-component system, OmpR family, response regulator MprA
VTAPRVLVVEDDPPIARLVARTARLEGAEVTLVGDGISARAEWKRRAFALVLLDAMLPGLDGLTLARERRLAGDRTPVVLMTARQPGEVGDLALEADIDVVLTKPFAYEELVEILRRYLQMA